MFRLLFGTRRPVSPSRVSVRPQLEILEGRTLPSGTAPTTQVVQFVHTEQKVIATGSQLVATDIQQLLHTEQQAMASAIKLEQQVIATDSQLVAGGLQSLPSSAVLLGDPVSGEAGLAQVLKQVPAKINQGQIDFVVQLLDLPSAIARFNVALYHAAAPVR
jgi:hypothetical protein